MRKTTLLITSIILLSKLTAAAPLKVEFQKIFGAETSNKTQIEFESTQYKEKSSRFSVFDSGNGIIEPGEQVTGEIEVTVSCGSADICYSDYWLEYYDFKDGRVRFFSDGNTYYISNGATETIKIDFKAPSSTGAYDVLWYSGYENDVSNGERIHTDTIIVEKDSDGDGIVDENDECPNEEGEKQYNGCPPPDSDNDGVPDDEDEFPNDPDCQEDTDNDGVCDNNDAFPNDPSETQDSDGDGVGDNSDEYPQDPECQEDSDDDGVCDNNDAFPNDPSETQDSDGDGVGDNSDEYPNDPDCVKDSDGDNVCDNNDPFPQDPDKSADTDGDGIADSEDACIDREGPEKFDGCPDNDGDGVPVNKDECKNTDPGLPSDSIGSSGCQISNPDQGGTEDGSNNDKDIGTKLDRQVFQFFQNLIQRLTSLT